MDIGMLWFDDDAKRSLNDKVARAVEHYKTKYGATPTVCFVKPSMLTAERAPEVAGGVQLRPARMVLVNHFWIGVGEAAQSETHHGNGARKNGNSRKGRN